MNKKVIKEYLKRVDDLNTRLVGKDKETFGWLIYGYNQCAKLLNETEQQCKKQREVIDKAICYIQENTCWELRTSKVLDILNEVSE